MCVILQEKMKLKKQGYFIIRVFKINEIKQASVIVVGSAQLNIDTGSI